MKKLLSIVALCALFCGKTAAQSIILKGKITNLPANAARSLAIEAWYNDKWRQLDSIGLSPAGYFEKRVAAPNAQCRLRVWGNAKAWLEFLLPRPERADAVLDFGFIAFQQMNGGCAYVDESENAAYFMMLTEQRKYQIKRDSVQAAMSALVGSDPDFSKKMTALLNLREEAAQRANRVFENIGRQKKGSFAGDVVAPMCQIILPSSYPNDTTARSKDKDLFFKNHFLDKLPTRDPRIIYFNGTVKLLRDFRTKYFSDDAAGLIDFAERVMQRRNGSEEVDLWLFQYLLDLFLDLKNDEAVTHLLKWYAPDCSSDDGKVPNHLKNLVLSLQNCAVGKPAFDASLADLNGQTVRFKDVAGKNKLTLLMFWRTSCSHCKEFKPILAKLYEKYHPLGLEVVAICTDGSEADWRTFLAANPAPWTNVRLTDEHREAFGKNFPVPGTPALIAVDEQYLVKNRMVIRASIEQYLADFFGQ